MTKSILSAFGAFISILCAVIAFAGYSSSGEDILVIMALIFCFAALVSVGYGIDGTKYADKISNLFNEEGGDNE